jgi:hypothetical protein
MSKSLQLSPVPSKSMHRVIWEVVVKSLVAREEDWKCVSGQEFQVEVDELTARPADSGEAPVSAKRPAKVTNLVYMVTEDILKVNEGAE